jgi:hypothetical protein
MKKYLLFLAAFFALSAGAQEFPYEFTVLTESYTDLEGSTSLNNGQVWDDPEYIVPIGFEFNYFGNVSSTLFMTNLGAGFYFPINNDFANIFFPYSSDIIDAGYAIDESMSPISYLLEGEPGSRIFKMEWNNCGFYYEVADLGVANNIVNLQMWLYEGSNDIDVRFGPNSIKSDGLVHDGFLTSLFAEEVGMTQETLTSVFALQGDPQAPTVFASTDINELFSQTFLEEDPTNGTVYHFGSTFVSVEDDADAKENWMVWPSIVTENINIQTDTHAPVSLYVHNLAGQQVAQQTLTGNLNQVSLSHLTAGIYLVRLQQNNIVQTYKIVKQ